MAELITKVGRYKVKDGTAPSPEDGDMVEMTIAEGLGYERRAAPTPSWVSPHPPRGRRRAPVKEHDERLGGQPKKEKLEPAFRELSRYYPGSSAADLGTRAPVPSPQ